ncbi:type II secretion system minor pseudopilin GspI [Citrobacter rodentium]|jgi:general secretion pathway protein I|uniref:Type II secretion system protein I n=2 Tax=Citrobacter rodentium TaxID=67825 RepID=D2TMH3_CITRI|nr:type II secretion system minor pseudopilin GspI [Citrobacter rodentium]QBY30757.1 type II secretion system protein GspI [Citrobacter rodentium]UHO31876.1 type II secretion system minor pseudopilin GspI [Citrobacter rodentium NBRC 105723 = DSM 16636]CBG91187.1 putative T2SS protein I [Citrobacter rodentium ICC168]HAT8014559.1 hypothetical protein [Citrobacter rodentium NBRC 105723 = DSM 16636]HAT8019417.1 hypothetical protein [Citrobacter rodentium]
MKTQQSGMLLLEVLVAMAILATAILALLISMQWQFRAIRTIQQETLALWSADNALIVARGGKLKASEGNERQRDLSFRWQLTATTRSSQTERQQIVVSGPDDTMSSLSAWLPVEPAE